MAIVLPNTLRCLRIKHALETSPELQTAWKYIFATVYVHIYLAVGSYIYLFTCMRGYAFSIPDKGNRYLLFTLGRISMEVSPGPVVVVVVVVVRIIYTSGTSLGQSRASAPYTLIRGRAYVRTCTRFRRNEGL